MNQNKNPKMEGLLKISEVAEAAGESVSTVKYYVKEGLIDIACKTGKNMAYYSPESVESVKLIRTLQNEKFFPLSVIKHILTNRAAGAAETELFYTINKADQADHYEKMPLGEAVREAGLKPREAEALIAAGLIVPTHGGHARLCTHGDCRLMKLVKTRMDAGIPLEQTIKSFSLYESHLRETTQRDIESLVRDCVLAGPLSTEQITKIILVSDETLDSFIAMKRYAMNASLGVEYVAKAERLLPLLDAYGRSLTAILKSQGYGAAVEKLEAALAGRDPGDPTIAVYGETLRIGGTGLAYTLSALFRAGNFWKHAAPACGDAAMDMVHGALRLGWAAFAPGEFGSDAVKARAEFTGGAADKEFTESVLRLVDKLQASK